MVVVVGGRSRGKKSGKWRNGRASFVGQDKQREEEVGRMWVGSTWEDRGLQCPVAQVQVCVCGVCVDCVQIRTVVGLCTVSGVGECVVTC